MKYILFIFIIFTPSVVNAFFQEIVITYNEVDYAFMRESEDCVHWGYWYLKPPRDQTVKPRSYKPRKVSNEIVWEMCGPAVIKFLENRPKVSGYYNFTDNKNYDWKKFAGDDYGTYSKKITVRIEPPNEK